MPIQSFPRLVDQLSGIGIITELQNLIDDARAEFGDVVPSEFREAIAWFLRDCIENHDPRHLKRLFAIRLPIETQFAFRLGHAARSDSRSFEVKKAKSNLLEIITKMERSEAGNWTEFFELDLAFHGEIARGAEAQDAALLIQELRSAYGIEDVYRFDSKDIEYVIDSHRKIYNAIFDPGGSDESIREVLANHILEAKTLEKWETEQENRASKAEQGERFADSNAEDRERPSFREEDSMDQNDVERLLIDYRDRAVEIVGSDPNEFIDQVRTELQHRIEGNPAGFEPIQCDAVVEEMLMRKKYGADRFVLYRWQERVGVRGEPRVIAKTLGTASNWADIVQLELENDGGSNILNPSSQDRFVSLR
ncbi:FCD domain protein [Roseimaritima multifibrata]|uniref:FCD domain protein n=1 Tax=Roseimaritima multifibrata TaxID=1930274 RepID=A0A517M944_9BACT|nr:FCD domain-containing protein [Roseimaritima multifibrata]QDS91418.1 FCD domain protein [Roseimaritima multifibrata]